jgi:hypothetical protein
VSVHRLPFEFEVAAISIAVFLTGLLIWHKAVPASESLSRRGVLVIGLLWTAFCTAEYWAFGSMSALGRADEYHSSIPWIYFLTHSHLGGSYAHGFAGGVDAVAGMVTGTQYLSIERFAFKALPLLGAVCLMKGGAIALAFSGGYKLARAGLALTRANAVAVGLLASGAHAYNFIATMGGLGWGTALMPWVFYFICLRAERPRYYVPLVVLALVYSGSTAITHSLPALFVAGLLACVLLPPARPWRCVLGAIVFGAVAILNWCSTLIAAIQVAPESARANAAPSLLTLKQWAMGNAEFFPLSAVFLALVILAVRRDRFIWTAAPVMVVAVAAGTMLSWFDWKATGINMLASYRWSLVSDGYLLPALIVVARALGTQGIPAAGRTSLARGVAAAALFATVAVASAGYQKGLNLINFRYYGSQALLERVHALMLDCAWRGDEPFRVVTVPSLFSPATATAYGLDAFDGVANNFPRRAATFFGMAVMKPPDPHPNVQYRWLNVPEGARELSPTVELNGLRIANVRYVLSDRPLLDPALKSVNDGCPGNGDAERQGALMRALGAWAPRAIPPRVYIHELTGTWPRAFIPGEVRISLSTHEERAFYDELLAAAARPIALVSRADAPMLREAPLSSNAYVLSALAVVPGGFNATVTRARESPASRGLLVINAPYSRFWHAAAAGRELTVLPVNGVHMGVVLEDVDGLIEMRYQGLK